ncbi:MAG: phosphoribosylanthranilate isomerase [Alphaproteobacteria bacterium]|nr:phosphoribosylanthranilate isomerase [Alphaproteobacteria bacterium]
MSVRVKICGIQDETALNAAAQGGASYAGFVFESASRRYISPEQAGLLIRQVPGRLQAVGLFVDPDDEELRAVTGLASLGMIQLHGLETPERVAAVRALTHLPVMKAMHIAAPEDFASVPAYEAVADMLLFDTKTGPKPTGGTGLSFNWELLKGREFTKPWMLAGGININNLAEAATITGARIVDLSSGVEDATGRKDPEKIRALLKLAMLW